SWQRIGLLDGRPQRTGVAGGCADAVSGLDVDSVGPGGHSESGRGLDLPLDRAHVADQPRNATLVYRFAGVGRRATGREREPGIDRRAVGSWQVVTSGPIVECQRAQSWVPVEYKGLWIGRLLNRWQLAASRVTDQVVDAVDGKRPAAVVTGIALIVGDDAVLDDSDRRRYRVQSAGANAARSSVSGNRHVIEECETQVCDPPRANVRI